MQVFLQELQLFTLAESLGGIESLVAHPASMTHAAMSVEDQQAAGISRSLLRLSVGIEHVDDLLADLGQRFRSRTCATVKNKPFAMLPDENIEQSGINVGI